ncbi:MAG: nucleoside triphosphate pyrophosphohydrolase [Deltaproteobacteria bacterium]|nr:nucleoside triphosphate pyrophosphohydrolase [Deltaproteobacteria bacterium]
MPDLPIPSLDRVKKVVGRLLDPDTGCPWDLKQTPTSLRLYLLEETYELITAIEQEDMKPEDPDAVKDEIGDCLFLLAMLAHLYQKAGKFDLDQALDRAADKMINRHPHIFADGRSLSTAEEVKAQWHELKKKETSKSILAGVPQALPALLRAHRLTERVGRVGFDWSKADEVLESLTREINELQAAMATGDKEQITDELGDVLFTATNLARHLKINAEDALRRTNDRFSTRFQYIEMTLSKENRELTEVDLPEMDRLWAEAKAKGL